MKVVLGTTTIRRTLQISVLRRLWASFCVILGRISLCLCPEALITYLQARWKSISISSTGFCGRN